MADSFFQVNTLCDFEGAPETFRHTPDIQKRCPWCGKYAPSTPVKNEDSDVEYIEQEQIQTEEDPKTIPKSLQDAARPPPRSASTPARPQASQALITTGVAFVQGEGEARRKESIAKHPSKSAKIPVLEPSVRLAVSIVRRGDDGTFESQGIIRPITLPNYEYSHDEFLAAVFEKITPLNRPNEQRYWLAGTLSDWQLSLSEQRSQGITAIKIEKPRYLSRTLTSWGAVISTKIKPDAYQIWLYHFPDSYPSTESPTKVEKPLIKKTVKPKQTSKSQAQAHSTKPKEKEKAKKNHLVIKQEVSSGDDGHDSKQEKRKTTNERQVKEEKAITVRDGSAGPHKRMLSSAEHPYSTRGRSKLPREDGHDENEGGIEGEDEIEEVDMRSDDTLPSISDLLQIKKERSTRKRRA